MTQQEGLSVESSDGRFSKDNAAFASTQQRQQSIFRCYPGHFSKGQQGAPNIKASALLQGTGMLTGMAPLEKNMSFSLTPFLEGTGPL